MAEAPRAAGHRRPPPSPPRAPAVQAQARSRDGAGRGRGGLRLQRRARPAAAAHAGRVRPALTPLAGKVALVTGASRGGGKGIALVLGEEGATVYITGRSVRGEPTTLDRPGTIDDTAEELTARGGTCVAVRCDHTDDSQVEALFERIRSEHGRLDL